MNQIIIRRNTKEKGYYTIDVYGKNKKGYPVDNDYFHSNIKADSPKDAYQKFLDQYDFGEYYEVKTAIPYYSYYKASIKNFIEKRL